MTCVYVAVLHELSYMDESRSSPQIESLVNGCRRKVVAADRGWKATVIGVAIVIATTLIP